MGTTIERNGGTIRSPQESPAHDTLSPEQRVPLHEMPDLSTHAPEVEYGQPRRSWLRYLAVGVTVGAVAVGAGVVISTLGADDVAPTYGSEYSLAREHLAQSPGGFPFIQPNGTTWSSMERSLEMEHIAQTPGGFPG
jgi:hypothetical protein